MLIKGGKRSWSDLSALSKTCLPKHASLKALSNEALGAITTLASCSILLFG